VSLLQGLGGDISAPAVKSRPVRCESLRTAVGGQFRRKSLRPTYSDTAKVIWNDMAIRPFYGHVQSTLGVPWKRTMKSLRSTAMHGRTKCLEAVNFYGG
jgi:hypothetical protein